MSDTETLQARAQEALRISGYPELRRLAVTASNGHIRLHGRVSTFFLKQMAQTLALSVHGAKRVENRVAVGAPD